MKLSALWIVRDPSPISEIIDILWEQDLKEFAYQILGAQAVGGMGVCVTENWAYYTSAKEAAADAKARLTQRDAKSTATPLISVY